MLKFPCNTHQLYQFESSGQRYIADIDSGYVLAVDEVLYDVLQYCSFQNISEIVETLKDKYAEETIFNSLDWLENVVRLGLFLSSEPRKQEVLDESKRFKFFTRYHPNARKLLLSLAEYADIHVAVPPDIEDEIIFEQDNISKILIQADTYSAFRYLDETYDGILALSPVDFYELAFLRCNINVPVITCAYSGIGDKNSLINITLAKATLLRDFDAIITDAIWVCSFFSKWFGCDVRQFHVIPDGIDLDRYRLMDKQSAKEYVKNFLGVETIFEQPTIGMILGLESKTNLQVGMTIASANPDLLFLVYDPKLIANRVNIPDNLFFFGDAHSEDDASLAHLFNALDILLLVGTLRVPGRLLTQAMACGLAVVVASDTDLPELKDCSKQILLESTDELEPIISFTSILQTIRSLLNNPEERLQLSQKAHQYAQSYIWEQTAKEILTLTRQLNKRKIESQHNIRRDVPNLFCRWYNRGQNTVQSQSVQLLDFSQVSIEKGIAQDLLKDFTRAEVEIIFRKFCKSEEEIKNLMKNIIPYDIYSK